MNMASSSYSSDNQSAVAEGLWQLADEFEAEGDVPATVKCLEAICQSERSFLPLVEVKTRLRLATFLFDHTNNIAQARSHLERAQMLLKNVPGNVDLKCCVLSLLSHCYQALDSRNLRKQVLQKGCELLSQAQDWEGAPLWMCNFQMQLIGASLQEGEPEAAIACARTGLEQAQQMNNAPLQLLFAATMLHAHMCTFQNPRELAAAADMCDQAWVSMTVPEREAYAGLSVYHRLLRAAHWLSVAEYGKVKPHLNELDSTLRSFRARQAATYSTPPPSEKHPVSANGFHSSPSGQPYPSNNTQAANAPLQTRSKTFDLNEAPDRSDGAGPSGRPETRVPGRGPASGTSLPLGPPPLDSEWLPLTAAEGLAALMWALHERPAGTSFKKCLERIRPAIEATRAALQAAGITPSSTSKSVSAQAYWDAQPYLILLQHLLEVKAGIELTQCDVRDAQTTIAEAIDLFSRFPTHDALQSRIQVLVGQYALTVGDFQAAVQHFQLAAAATEDADARTLITIQTALAHLSANSDADRSAAVDLVTPLVQESALPRLRARVHSAALFASSMLQALQGQYQEARFQIGRGLKQAHKQLGNHQLVSQFLAMLGSVNRALNDLPTGSDVLKSAFTLAKSEHDLLTQISALEEMANIARLENNQAHLEEAASGLQKKRTEFRGQVQAALSTPLHAALLQYGCER
ncbi:hypothetical protein KFL_002610150 [Klebsormidium nitens]|uniref:Uncharacterized protein n=1 Tax=Klebsormidium nitens TaxID=105231 RepID=A0A1Y1I937_KLENI|nr:hypothetical protein KFL_002610150 [Klebsormidium nitens]|eukprot:GAQ85929.1 hypothetical protein KFL_002610150 [Klebsormidium nitens]